MRNSPAIFHRYARARGRGGFCGDWCCAVWPLIFLCPRTRKAIDAGIAVDDRSRSTLFENPVTVACAHCGEVHEFRMRQSYSPGEAA